MAYATTKQVVERIGLSKRVLDENVGTGNNSNVDFDLDNTNIIATSYVLSYATAGSNTLTALTETTHYSLDKESGRVVLTSAGVTALGTKILYATYSYTEEFSDSVLSEFIESADDEIEKITGRKWDTPTETIEYFDGRHSSNYPTTDRPYDYDYDAPDKIILNKIPVTSVKAVYFLSSPLPVSKCYNYDDSLGTYTDKTTEINSITETPFSVWASVPASGDVFYISSSNRFLGITTYLSTIGVAGTTPTIVWEYWNGTAWSILTVTDINTGTKTFTTSGSMTWSYPYGWAKTSVNGSDDLYYIRGRITGVTYSVYPVIATIVLNDCVDTILQPREFLLDNSGKVNFVGSAIIDGTKNIRIDYSYGMTVTPTYITELSVLLSGIRAYIYITGGSYDAATSYSLGSKTVSIGEQYVNIREVIDQYRKRINELLDSVGRRCGIAVI